MAGSRIGGLKAKEANLKKDPNWYSTIGRIGGTRSKGGGFAAGEAGRERARKVGSIGGKISRRGAHKFYDYNGKQMCLTDIAHDMGLSPGTLRRRLRLYGSIYGYEGK